MFQLLQNTGDHEVGKTLPQPSWGGPVYRNPLPLEAEN